MCRHDRVICSDTANAFHALLQNPARWPIRSAIEATRYTDSRSRTPDCEHRRRSAFCRGERALSAHYRGRMSSSTLIEYGGSSVVTALSTTGTAAEGPKPSGLPVYESTLAVVNPEHPSRDSFACTV